MNHVHGLFGLSDIIDVVNIVNPSALVSTFPVLTLDTRNRILSDISPASRTKLSWNFYNNSRFSQGAVNGIGDLRDVVSIEPAVIYLPNVSDQSFIEYRQISMYIHEFSEQASILTDKVRYHFLFNAETVTNDSGTARLKLSPAFDNATMVFNKPLATIDTLTISFGCPAEKITFGYDRDPGVPTSITNANPAVVTTSVSHGLNNGDLIYLENVVSTSSADSAILAIANQEKGHIIQNVTATTFEIAGLDSSAAAGTLSCTGCIFGSQRFFIPLKFKYLATRKFD